MRLHDSPDAADEPARESLPRVSVVIPTYDRSRMAVRAVRSVLAQTVADIEVIVVDDASTDDTEQQIAALDDARVCYVRHAENRGGSAARNTGLGRAQGPYVAFLDSDDVWRPRKLEKQLAVVSEQAPVVYTGFAKVDETGAALRAVHPQRRGAIRETLLVENCVGTTSTVLARRVCLERVGGFDERLPSSQDHDLWIRLSRHYAFGCVPEVLVDVYRHAGARITTDLEARRTGLTALFEKHRAAIEALGSRAVAEHHFRLGRKCLRGRAARPGLRHVGRAIRLWPFRAEYYVHLLAGLMGMPAYHALVGLSRRVRHGLD